MGVVEEGTSPPPLLTLAWECEKYKSLPDSGGVLDQGYIIMRSMGALSNIYSTVDYMRSLRGAQIHNLSSSQLELLRWLKDNKYLVI